VASCLEGFKAALARALRLDADLARKLGRPWAGMQQIVLIAARLPLSAASAAIEVARLSRGRPQV
jgi:hypothetical protein